MGRRGGAGARIVLGRCPRNSEGPDTVAGPVFLDDSHLIQAMVAGQGGALLSLVLVRDALTAGYLVQPFGPELPGYAYRLLHPPDTDCADEIDALKD